MGSSVHRLQLLIIAGLILISALIVVVMLWIIPPSRKANDGNLQPIGSTVQAAAPTTTTAPTAAPTATVAPTVAPTATAVPTPEPTATAAPTAVPTMQPTAISEHTTAEGRSRTTLWLIGGIVILVLGIVITTLLWQQFRRRPGLSLHIPHKSSSQLPDARASIIQQDTPQPVLAVPIDRRETQTEVQLPASTTIAGEHHIAPRPNRLADIIDEIPTIGLGVSTAPAADLQSASDNEEPGAEQEVPPSEAALVSDASDLTLKSENQALMAIEAVIRVFAARRLLSPILAVDVNNNKAQVMFDLRPHDAEHMLLAAAEDITSTYDWRCYWQEGMLHIIFSKLGELSSHYLPAVPILRTGRRGQTTRYISLQHWRHLLLCGDSAYTACHAILTTLLLQQRPADLGVTILDPRNILASFYQTIPHLVPAETSPADIISRTFQSLQVGFQQQLRTLVFVVVEPDDAQLMQLASLLGLLRHHPNAPLHLLVVQKAPKERGRDVYAIMPSIVTEGIGEPNWVRLRQWPRRGQAIVTTHVSQWTGRPILMSDTEAAQTVQRLPSRPVVFKPVLWQTVSTSGSEEQLDETHQRDSSTPVETAADQPAQDSGPDTDAVRLGALIDRARPRQRPQHTAHAAAAQTAATQTMAAVAEPSRDDPWPALPGRLTSGQVQEVMRAALDDAIITGQAEGTPAGISLRRLTNVVDVAFKPHLPDLLNWLDQADVLEPAKQADNPFRFPRPFKHLDADWIAHQLMITPPR